MQIYWYTVDYYSGGSYPLKKTKRGYTIAESEEQAIENIKEEYGNPLSVYVEKRTCIELKEDYK